MEGKSSTRHPSVVLAITARGDGFVPQVEIVTLAASSVIPRRLRLAIRLGNGRHGTLPCEQPA